MRVRCRDAIKRIYETRAKDGLDPILVRIMLAEAYETGYTDGRESTRKP